MLPTAFPAPHTAISTPHTASLTPLAAISTPLKRFRPGRPIPPGSSRRSRNSARLCLQTTGIVQTACQPFPGMARRQSPPNLPRLRTPCPLRTRLLPRARPNPLLPRSRNSRPVPPGKSEPQKRRSHLLWMKSSPAFWKNSFQKASSRHCTFLKDLICRTFRFSSPLCTSSPKMYLFNTVQYRTILFFPNDSKTYIAISHIRISSFSPILGSAIRPFGIPRATFHRLILAFPRRRSPLPNIAPHINGTCC